MRIKRFIAPDIRSALRMVRDEQGAEAVILSNRTTVDGIEIVAATDYDETLVQQALRTATSGEPATEGTAARPAAPAGEAAAQATFEPAPAAFRARGESVSWSARAEAVAREPALASAERGQAATRRAVFQIDERPTLESRYELTQADQAQAMPLVPTATAAVATQEPPMAEATGSRESAAPSRFEMMMAALTHQYVAAPAPAAEPPPAQPSAAVTTSDFDTQIAPPTAADTAPAGPLAAGAPSTEPCVASSIEPACGDPVPATDSAPALQTVPNAAIAEPAMAAMREELGLMRRMIERELGQMAGERLRGSASRALAMDLLLDYGCTQSLAQAVAERIDPDLDPARVPPVMLAALAQMLPVQRDEPLETGGIIALVGPTGAGKTTTTAKLAARFAARHRARDVALVTTDHHRTGAREQLQGFGRRLGITVCEAAGPESLSDTLQQLADYPLVLVDTAGYAGRDRALGSQLAWLRTTRNLRSLLVLPANGNPLDLADIVRRYRGLRPEAAVLTKIDETGRLGAALSVLLEHELRVAYTSHGQQVPTDLEPADASRLVLRLEKLRRAADNPLVNEDRHAIA
ncbi:flagellar biosynthesis protein FlhF [Aerolutibacter ruishenii]|uniref:Flagellar biosynthesis protein FlhF n=1 Tax=Aerolutibacter ruishenii TaxID=686800 RepID=A0A562LK67_9GAMM|nr:flagellar biosynthesis protein FlhF [Lysobacter ruishenii]TWI08012.1 flagellar biosynthesis protein FlhF [Lysobacter ruishenii]